MMNEEQQTHSDLVQIYDTHSILIYAHQLNQYYHTLLGNPFARLKYYNSQTEQYHFYRTPGIVHYIITYYLHHGSLSTEIHYPVEILYDELLFFGFNIQIIYEIVSNLITIEYYIPSGKYRRAFWLRFDYETRDENLHLTRILSGLVTLCSIITSLLFVEISNHLFDDKQYLIRKMLITEIFILIFSYVELSIQYFIRPKLRATTMFLILINFLSLIPIALLLFIWTIAPTWLYTLLVLQLSARMFRSLRLSPRAYHIMYALTNRLAIYFQSFEMIALIILVFALITLACEEMFPPVEFLVNQYSNKTNQFEPFSEIIWISVNAFTSLGEGTTRPLTLPGLIIEFFTCFLGFLIIPQITQTVYTIVSNTIDKQKINDEKRQKKHLVRIEDEHGNKAIGQVNVDEDGYSDLPEILIQKDEF